MRCERKDGSVYGTDGTCRKGIQIGPQETVWIEKQSKQWPSLRGKFQELGEAVAKLPEDQREIFNKQIGIHLNADNMRHNWKNLKGEKLKKGEERLPYDDAKKIKALESQIKGWKEMIRLGYPTKLQLRDGTLVKAPEGMLPIVTQASGQKKYVREHDNRAFNIKAGGIATQNRAGKEDTNKYVPAATTFKKEQESKGGKWPTQTLPPRTDIELDADKIMTKLTPGQKRAIATNGLAKDGTEDMPGAILHAFYLRPENKGLLEGRVREVVDRYVAQGGRSGVTGLPIAIPGLQADPKKGEGKSTVDHFTPISTGKGMTPQEIKKQFDNKGNFLLAEEGPNSNRSNIPWPEWLKRENAGGVKKGPTYVPIPSQEASGNPYAPSKPKRGTGAQSLQSRLDELLNDIRND